MILAIIIISLAFFWLMYETDFMRVRLLVGAEYRTTDKQVDITNTPYYWKSPEQKEQHIIICHNKWDCPYRKQCQKLERWVGWKLPARTINAFGHKLNLIEQCNILRALALKSIYRDINRKPTVYQPPLFKREFIYQVREGSHHEYIRWNDETMEYDYSTKPKKGYFHRVVEDYITKYADCLPGKAWLKEHANDEYLEPTIDISIDGKNLSVNGNYKPSLIKDFMGEYTYKARAGKKTLIAMKGQQIINCGGGVYIAQ